jgi:hypothetical protein
METRKAPRISGFRRGRGQDMGWRMLRGMSPLNFSLFALLVPI